MQIDFHFYTIYFLARAAGFKHENSHIIAYSSQHTDDAKYEHALEFDNGGRFQQILTAHKYLDLNVLTKSTCYRIWVPFHFFPGNLGEDFYEGMITRSNSVIAQRLIDDFLSSPLKPYSLHHLGIILHLYADMWSHQNFMGLIRDNINDVRKMKIEGEKRGFIKAQKEELKKKFFEYLVPELGHAQAGTIPDEPYRNWEYENYKGRYFQVSNQERAIDAAQHIYAVLLRFLKRFPQYSSNPSLPRQNIVEKVSDLFKVMGDIEGRTKAWQDAISNAGFGFESEGRDNRLTYDDREWFKVAVEVIKTIGVFDSYKRKPGFENSNWKYFHDAAAYHRFCVLHEILPEYGIICG